METDLTDPEHADSAVNVKTEATSTIVHDLAMSESEAIAKLPVNGNHELSDKMRQIAAAVWTLEQDECISAGRRRKIQEVLAVLDRLVETEGDKTIVDDMDDVDEDEWMEEQDLIDLRAGVAAALETMRFRQEEQTHLHELTVNKIEAVAQRCIAQEQEAQALLSQLHLVRAENDALHAEKARLCARISELPPVFAQKGTAVSVASSAVKGLEGWIDVARPVYNYAAAAPPLPSSSERRKVVVTRGRGRFRGRYFVEEGEHLGDQIQSSDQELDNGVKAWLQGFQDVGAELQQYGLQNRGRASAACQSMPHPKDNWRGLLDAC